MRRTVSARLDLAISDPAEIALQIAVGRGRAGRRAARDPPRRCPGRLARPSRERTAAARISSDVGRGQLAVTYAATVIGRAAPPDVRRRRAPRLPAPEPLRGVGPARRVRAAAVRRPHRRRRRFSGRSRRGSAGSSATSRAAACRRTAPSTRCSAAAASAATSPISSWRCFAPATSRRASPPSTRRACSRWTSTPSPRRSSTGPGGSSTRRCSRRARRSSASRRAATPQTRRFSP